MSKQIRTILLASVILTLIMTPYICAQSTVITNSTDTIVIENDWLHVTMTKIEDFVAPGSIIAVYDKRNDSGRSNSFVNGRWLDMSVDVMLGNQSYTVRPDKLKWVKKYSDRFVVRSSRFIDTTNNKVVPITMKMTVRLVRNRIYVDYLFSFNARVTLNSSLLLSSFMNNTDMDKVEAFNWSRFNHRNPVRRVASDATLTFDPLLQPCNQVRFKGDIGSVDFHAPDVSMDHVALSNTAGTWILFQQLLPYGTNCSGDHIKNVISGGTSISRAVAILVNDSENTDKFQRDGQPTATLSPIPYGKNNLVVTMADDVPTMTNLNGNYYVIGGEETVTGAPIDQAYSFLKDVPGVKLDLNLIFDSMLTVSQADADRRHYPNNSEIFSDAGAGYYQIWKFHNRIKNVADMGGANYHKWLKGLQDDDSSIGIVNRSYHGVRLEDVRLAEWEEDPRNRAQEVTPAYITSVLGSLKSDAAKIGINMPSVYIPPQLIFDQDLIEPLVKTGSESMVFCKRWKYPHPVYSPSGPLNAIFYNWNPNEANSHKILLNNIRKGWPIIALGEYFDGVDARYQRIVNSYNRALEVSPDLIFLKASEYSTFITERNGIRFWREEFDVDTGTYEMRFEGSSSSGVTFVMNVDPQVRNLDTAPRIDGQDVEDYRVDEGKIFIVLPELKDKVHTLVVDLY